MSPDHISTGRDVLCNAIREAMTLADEQGRTLVAALLCEALDAAHCGSDDDQVRGGEG